MPARHIKASDAPPRQLHPAVIQKLCDKFATMQHGRMTVIVQNGKVLRFEFQESELFAPEPAETA